MIIHESAHAVDAKNGWYLPNANPSQAQLEKIEALGWTTSHMMAATQLKPLRGLEDFLQKPGTTSQQIATMWGSAVEASNEIFSATIAWNNGAEERNVRVADIQDVKDKLGLNIGMGKLIEKYQDVANNKGIAYTFKLTDVPFRGKIYSVPPVLR